MVFSILSQFAILAFAITVHEFSHGYVAYKLGDYTAKYYGRLSFNPLVHIDPVGTILLPLTMVMLGLPPLGWAKAVPVNFSNLRNPKRDMLWVGIAGPFANFLSAAAAAAVLKIPLVHNSAVLAGLLSAAVLINLILGVFNLIPIPPLDGSRIVTSLMPRRYMYVYNKIEKYGIIIILGLLWLGALRKTIYPIVIKLAALLQVNISL